MRYGPWYYHRHLYYWYLSLCLQNFKCYNAFYTYHLPWSIHGAILIYIIHVVFTISQVMLVITERDMCIFPYPVYTYPRLILAWVPDPLMKHCLVTSETMTPGVVQSGFYVYRKEMKCARITSKIIGVYWCFYFILKMYSGIYVTEEFMLKDAWTMWSVGWP